MNKQKYIAVIILLLFLLIVLIYALSRGGSSSVASINNPPAANDSEVEKRITWGQNQLSVSVFSTREDPVGQLIEDKQNVHIMFTSFFSITSLYPMKEISMDVVEFKQNVGNPTFLFPPHTAIQSSRSYIYTDMNSRVTADDIKDSGRRATFSLVSSNPTNYDELMTGGGFLNFGLITKNLGTLSEQTIMDRDKIYDSAKLLQYLGTTAEQLNGSVVLDFHITFEDGKTYNKRFSGVIEGDKILNQTFYQIDMK